MTGVVSFDAGFGCILTDTITWNGTVDITTGNFTGSGTESIVSKQSRLMWGLREVRSQ